MNEAAADSTNFVRAGPEPAGPILRYVYALLATVILMTAAAVAVAYWGQTRWTDTPRQVSDYHSNTIRLLDRVERSLEALRLVAVRRHLADQVGDPRLVTRLDMFHGLPEKPATVLQSLDADLQKIVDLQARFQGADFARTLTRLHSQLGDLHGRVGRRGRPHLPSLASLEDWERLTEASLLTVNQLKRLHAIAEADELAAYVAGARRGAIVLGGLVVLMLGLGTAGGIVLIARIRKALEAEKSARDDLAKSQARLHFLVHAGPAVIYACKTSGDYGATFISENITAQTGYVPQDFLNDSAFWADNIHPEDRERVLSDLARLFEDDAHVHEYRFRHKDGHYLWMRDECRLIYDEHGGPREIAGFWVDVTERKEAEAALRDSEERLSSITGNLPVAVYRRVLHADGTVSYPFMSAGFKRIFSVDPERAVADTDYVVSTIHPDDRERGYEAMKASARTLERYDEVKRRIGDDGKVAWTRSVGYPRRLANGDTVWDGVAVDVTEQMRAEEALRDSESRLKEAQRIARIGSWELDLKDNVLTWSDEIYRMFEIDPTSFDAAYEAFLAAIRPDDRETVDRAYNDSLANRTPYEIVHRLRMPDGRVKWVHERCETDFDVDGKPLVSRGTVQDVTDLKIAEEALKESETRYARAVAGTNDGIWDWNIRTGEDYFSQRWAEIVGYEPGELEPVMRTFTDLVHPDDVERVSEAIRAHLEERVRYDIEFRLRHKSGDFIWVRARGQAIWDDDDTPLRMAGSISDITERKHVEAEVRGLNEDLERRVEERTAELRAAQDDLLRAERLATLGRLTATVSHELRNPLAAVRTSAFVLRKGLDGEDARSARALERIERSVVRCDRIIDELLDFTRMSRAERQSIVLDHWLLEILDDQDIPPEVVLLPDLRLGDRVVAIDPERLRRAIVNVVDNACQAMADQNGEHKKVLRVCTAERDERIEIVVEDSGTGISPAVRKRVFEPLFSTKSFGVGLGMPIVRQIMKQHGGGIDLDSEVGRGTRVRLWLDPRAKAAEAAA